MTVLDFWTPKSAADASSILGLVITVVGFVFTLISVTKSKDAAKRAEKASKEAVGLIKIFDTVADVSSAVAIMDEIKRLHRHNAWSIILDRYSALRKIFVEIKENGNDFLPSEKETLERSILIVDSLERKVEAIIGKGNKPDSTKLNKEISESLIKVHEMLVALKNKARIK